MHGDSRGGFRSDSHGDLHDNQCQSDCYGRWGFPCIWLVRDWMRELISRNRRFRPEGALWVGLGFTITVIPVILVAAVSIKWMKIDFGSVAGMLCGSMSNPMALNYVNSTVDSDTPSVVYATVYPLTMFVRVIMAQVILMLFL